MQLQPSPSENERSSGPRLFPLRTGRVVSLTPLIIGFVTAVVAVDILSVFHPLSPLQFNAVGVIAGVLATALASTLARRGIPDGLRLTDTALELLHGARILRRVDLTRLKEVSEFQAEAGPILMVSDRRRHITLPSFALADERHYEDLTNHIVEAMARIDPSGTVARGAVSTGRLRREIWEQPVRGTYYLSFILFLASLLAMRNRQQLGGEPFPDEAVGALSGPLVLHGETYRLFSYLFPQATFMHLAVCAVGILYIGGYLEKLLGWERVLLGFTAGALGGALAHMLLAPPVAAAGLSGGLYGLFGLLGAVALLKRRLPPTLAPQTGFWVMTVIFALLLPTTADIPTPMPLLPEGTGTSRVLLEIGRWLASFTALDIGGAALGFVVGALMIIGVEIPASAHARAWMRPFAILGAVALAIGLLGGLRLMKRNRYHDAEIVAQALLDLPHTHQSGEILNSIAYPRLIEPTATPHAIDVAARLAQMAVDNTDRQNPSILDILAVARYRQKQVGEARSLINEAQRKARELQPRVPALERAIQRHLEDIERGVDLRPDVLFER